MGDVTDVTAEEFNYGELVLIAEELGLSPVSRWPKRKLVDICRLQLKLKGIPAPVPEDKEMTRAQELLEDFLYVSGYVDEEGEPQEGKNDLTLEDFMEQHNIPKLPPCFSTVDDKDPSCSRCMLYKYCSIERIIKLPPCFGLMYDPKNEECMGCLEAPFCVTAMPKENSNTKS